MSTWAGLALLATAAGGALYGIATSLADHNAPTPPSPSSPPAQAIETQPEDTPPTTAGGTVPSGSPSPSPSPTAPTSPRHPSVNKPQGKAAISSRGALDPDSNDHWAQNNLTLRVQRPLRALTVTIRVVRTERVQATGSWLTLPSSNFKASTETTRDAVVYRWTLLPKRTVGPGSYVLAAQYNRTTAHNSRKDAYTVRATERDGPAVTAEGHF
ncbi:hypothetical protein [Actinomadura sp. 3N407]|uniref:hypothetical protein n=1 Tax=Actinomadura sp. 3N407 TaxID=3457423 RepID=UPI003FCC67CD